MPWLDRERRAALDAEERLFWAIVISLAVTLSLVLFLAVFHRYSFNRLLLGDAAIAAAAAALSQGRLRLGPAARRPGLTALIPAALVLLGLMRFFPPSEYIMGGKDPGVYMTEGIQIAQRGAIVVSDPVVASVPPFARDLFFPSHQRPQHDFYGVRFMGYFIKDPSAGTVVGQFPHLFPASIAVAYGLDGLTGARRAVGAWAILGVIAVYFAGVRLVGRTAAAAAAALLALHVIEVWFARYPNAEVVMQALLFAALLANARAHVDGDRFFAPVAATLLGLLLFLRFDAVLGVAGVLGGLVLGVFNGQRPRASFVVIFLALSGLAAMYLFGPMRVYMDLPIVFLSKLPWWEYVVLGLVAAAALGILQFASRVPAAPAIRWIPLVVTAVVWLLALYALFLRHPAGKLAIHDAYALRTFTNFYLTLPALLAALIGFALVARRAWWRDPSLFVTVVVFSCFLFYKIRIVPDHFWMARRFLPVILPGALLFAAAAALSGARGGWNRAGAVRSLIGVAFVSMLALHYGRASRPLLDHVEYAGMIAKLEDLAGKVGDEDLLIVESRNAEGDIHVLATPLAYVYARQVLLLNSPRPGKPAFAAFLEWARTRYRRVLFIGGGGTDLLSHRYGVQAIASERFGVPEYDSPLNAYPRFVRRKDFDYGLYAFTPPEPVDARWFDLDVGILDDLHVLRFHAKEESEGRTIRWTRATSYVSVTVMRPSSREVTLWMNDGGRSRVAPPAEVTVSLDGQLLGSIRLTTGFAPYTLPIPPDLARRASELGDPVELKLVTSTWNPHTVLGAPDDRDLGVMVDRVAVK